MAGATLPTTDGTAYWADNFDNWRSADADYLQKRSVMRFTSQSTRNGILGPSNLLPSPAQGQVTYIATGGIDGNGGLEYADSTGLWRSVFSVKHLGVNDSDSGFGLRLGSDLTAVLSLETNKVVLGSNRILSVESSKLVFQTGAATAELTTNADSLVSNVKITAPSASLGAAAATSLSVSGNIAGGAITASSSLTATSLVVSGTSALGTSSSVGALNASVSVTGLTIYGTLSVRAANVLIAGSRLSNYGAASQFLELSEEAITVGGDALILKPTETTTPVRYRTSDGAPFALVVVSSVDPGLANYPDGTIWVQP